MRLRPQPGLCVPVEAVHIRDGDTLVVRLSGSSHEWAIRLIDCWAPESHEPGGKEATEHLQVLVDGADGLLVQIPAPRNTTNPLKNLTFDRIPGYVWINETETLNDRMVLDGFATREKGE